MVEKIRLVVDTLSAGGIRARRGYPTDKFFQPKNPVAAVYLERAQGETVTVAAEIFGTGASDCEDCADAAFGLLESVGNVCMAESCRFDPQMGLFSMRLLIRWEPAVEPEPEPEPEPVIPYTVYLEGKVLPYVTSFSAGFSGELYQSVSEDGQTQILYTAKVWSLTLEELIPPEVEQETDTPEVFTVTVVRDGSRESYSQCRWDSIRRTETA